MISAAAALGVTGGNREHRQACIGREIGSADGAEAEVVRSIAGFSDAWTVRA